MKRKLMAGMLGVVMMMSIMGCGKEEAATAKADENGNYVVNGSFEESEWGAWTVTNIDDVTEELDIYTRETDCYEGVQSLHYYSSGEVNFTAEQTLNLEEGTYKLSGYFQGDTAGDADAQICLYAIVDGETYKANATLSGYLAWNLAEVTGLNVTGGEVTIGISVTNAPGGWGTVDSITLVKE